MLRLLAVLVLTVVGLLVQVGSAAAHARLVASSPAEGAVLATAPSTVTLRFAEGVELGPDAITVLGPDGQPIGQAAAPTSVDVTVTVALPAGLAQGSYAVRWRVVSEDSHPVSGTLTFAIGHPGTVASPAPAASTEPMGVAFGLVRALALTAFVLLAGSVAAVLTWWPGGRSVRWVRRLWTAAGSTLAAATVATFLLQGPYTTGAGVASILDPAVLATTVGLPSGVALLLRLAMLALATPYLVLLRSAPVTPLRCGGVLLALGLAPTWSATGHAATGPDLALGIPLDALHLVAIAFWLGGLAVLVGLCRCAGTLPAVEVRAAVERFSALAGPAVGVIVVTGSYTAVRQVGSVAALFGTDYGRLLLLKLLVVAVALVIAAVSRQWVARLRELDAPAPTPPARILGGHRGVTVIAPSRRGERRTAAAVASTGPGLARTVAVELCAGLVVVGITAALMVTEPARVAQAAATAPPPTPVATGYAGPVLTLGSGGSLQVAVEPALVGNNAVIVLLADAEGRPLDVTGATAVLTAPGAAPARVALPRLVPGHLHGEAGFDRPGRWELTITLPNQGTLPNQTTPWTVTSPIVIGGS